MVIKYSKKILYSIIFLTYVYSQSEIDLNLTIINSGKYSLSSFLDPNINLWQVDIINNYEGNDIKDLRLEVDMKKDGITVIWGVSKPIELKEGIPISSRTNMNFTGTDLAASGFDDNFYNDVQTSGVLPAGEYELTIRSYILGLYSNRTNNTYDLIDKEDKKVDSPYISEETRSLLNLNIDEKIVLLSPANIESIYDSNPWFRWESPGFGIPEQPITVEYKLIVALFNPDLHSSLEDALNDDINIYFDSGWTSTLTSIETGVPNQIAIQYPPSEKELSCGYQYCWRVEARERIDGFQSYNGGIWGWPEPAKSDEIYSFYYGTSLSENEISSPGSYVNSVTPTFSFSSVLCADSYEIWISKEDDPEVVNPILKSDYIQDTNFQYPISANGLSPGEKYFWKVRVNPETTPGPWSNIFSFTVNDISLLLPSEEETINTLFPTFNISSPNNISEYQILISDASDPQADNYNVLSENFDFFPYDFPINNEIMLSPGETYYWKVQTIDDNGNYTKLINENLKTSSFIIKPIELIFPTDGASNTSLTPLFSWEAPIGVNEYLIEFTNEYDPEFDDIIFSNNINNSFFLSSNFSANLPFENGTTYLWRVKPINNNGQVGTPSESFTFSTILNDADLNILSSETNYEQLEFNISLSGIEGKDINVSIINGLETADTYLLQLSDNPNMDNIIDEADISSNVQTYSFPGESLNWEQDYYIQIFAYLDGMIIGDPSNIKMIVTPFEPGSQDQVGFNVELNHNIIPSLVIIINNTIDNATDYIFRLSENSDMTNFLFSDLINSDMQYVYENLDGLLNFGNTYYIQLIPLKDGQLHGISNINSIFIPNIIPPKASNNPFDFEHSIPQSISYLVEISTTEDFAVILYSDITETNSINISNDVFLDGTPYYWRIRGIDNNNYPFGLYSNPEYFISSGESSLIDETNQSNSLIILENPSNELIISTKYPTFSWENYDGAEKYEIIVSKNSDLTNIVWNSQNIFTNNTIYPTSGSEELNYNTIYYWAVRPINNNTALASFTEPFSFSISSNFIPEITTPKESTDEIRPYFSWTKIQNANKYGLIISEDDSYTKIIYNNQNINDNILQYPDDAPMLSYNTEYFWKVIALSNDDSPLGDYSNSTRFTTPSGLIKLEFIFENDD